MKKVTKLFMAALLAGMCNYGYAQDFLAAPKPNEKVLGTISVGCPGSDNDNGTCWGTPVAFYNALLKKAMQQFPNKVIDIRQMIPSHNDNSSSPWCGPVVGKVIDLGGNPEIQTIESLSKAMEKALRNVREGSRLAIDQVTVIGSMDRENLKDQLIDILLDKGYKVVAKEYLDKLYEEQQTQQSGIYNDRTTVQTDNFSAVGYYINVKVTETSLRVQVVNVSTGEYEGNATVNF